MLSMAHALIQNTAPFAVNRFDLVNKLFRSVCFIVDV